MEPVHIHNIAEFNALIGGSKPVVIDFYAQWCGPCKMIAPKYAELAKNTPAVAFAKCDVDEAGDVAERCGISCMPTFQFFKGGECVNELQGANYPKLANAVQSLIA